MYIYIYVYIYIYIYILDSLNFSRGLTFVVVLYLDWLFYSLSFDL